MAGTGALALARAMVDKGIMPISSSFQWTMVSLESLLWPDPWLTEVYNNLHLLPG